MLNHWQQNKNMSSNFLEGIQRRGLPLSSRALKNLLFTERETNSAVVGKPDEDGFADMVEELQKLGKFLERVKLEENIKPKRSIQH